MNRSVQDTFRAEAREILENLEETLLRISEGKTRDGDVHAAFRFAHNLKGAAKTAGFADVGEFAHVVEELLSRWRDRTLVPSRAQASWVLSSLDVLRGLLEGNERSSQTETTSAAQHTENMTIRVPMNRLDGAVRTVGELIILAGKVDANVIRLTGEQVELSENCQDLFSLLGELQEQLMKMRLVPVAPLLERISQLGRETAGRLGKSVRFEIEGLHEEVDASLLENLRDPLVHMIRNAVDHGIEGPERRKRAGKPEVGTIQLRAYRTSARAIIELNDDGGGLDRKRILDKAKRMGLVAEHDNPSDEAICDLIFRPGFSTSAQIDDVSGRGVGMDVVRHNVERLNGKVRVHSEFGKGSRFEISIPMNLSVQRGFQVAVNGKIFVLPAEQVMECLPIHRDFASKHAGAQASSFVQEVRGRATACIDLRTYLQVASTCDPVESATAGENRPSLVVVNCEGKQVGLLVDRVHGEQRSVMRPLGPFFLSVPDLAGAILLGDGSVGLLLDPQIIAENVAATQLELARVQTA